MLEELTNRIEITMDPNGIPRAHITDTPQEPLPQYTPNHRLTTSEAIQLDMRLLEAIQHGIDIEFLQAMRAGIADSLDDEDHHTSHEVAIDLNGIFAEHVSNERSHTHMSVLPFAVIIEDGGLSGPHNSTANFYENSQSSVYRTYKEGSTNILFKFSGWDDNLDRDCTIAYVLVKFSKKSAKGGLVFASKDPIMPYDTEKFNNMDKAGFDLYMNTSHDNSLDDPVAWFDITEDSLVVVEMQRCTSKFVAIKLLRDDRECLEIEYIAFIGSCGPKAFTHGSLC